MRFDESLVREKLIAEGYVSRETCDRIAAYLDIVRLWQPKTNLVAPSTLGEVWSRHVLDSAQLLMLQPNARCWVDFGSGGGFPGLVIACAMPERQGQVHLVESNQKKAAFLRHVCVTLDLPATIHADRAERIAATLPDIEVTTARALATLDTLLGYSSSLLKTGAIGLFPKGRDHVAELTDARRHWHFSYQLHPSMTEQGAAIVEITQFAGRKAP